MLSMKMETDQPGDVPYTCADVAKAKHLLGYQAAVPFEEGIKRTVEWYKEAYPQYSNMLKKNNTQRVVTPPSLAGSPKVETRDDKQISNKTSPAESSGTQRPSKQHQSEDNEDEVRCCDSCS